MYIARVRLDVGRRITQLALEAPAKLHGAVEKSFQIRQNRTLWRIDKLEDNIYLLIISEAKPDLTVISQQFGFKGDCGEVKQYDAFLDNLKAGTMWRFRLVANPTRSLKRDSGRGKVVSHVSAKYQMDWLEKAAKTYGFSVLTESTRIVSSMWKDFYKKGTGGRVRFREVTYEGILEIKNEEKFRLALTEGIGREKAYGMGMLTVIRV